VNNDNNSLTTATRFKPKLISKFKGNKVENKDEDEDPGKRFEASRRVSSSCFLPLCFFPLLLLLQLLLLLLLLLLCLVCADAAAGIFPLCSSSSSSLPAPPPAPNNPPSSSSSAVRTCPRACRKH
jgi:hypothetical protein